MEATELDILLEDLETRVERLRSLYEQYFLGIEKIPPHVAQKDVDRRLYALRHQQIRNTARRFKLQTIVQRYNTFQQYWMRIMREIENGTYRRHVLRAERTVGITGHLTAAERKRLALPEPEAHPSAALEVPIAPQDEDLDDSSLVATNPAPAGDKSAREAPPSLVPNESPGAVRAQIERDLGLLLDEDLDELDTQGMSELGSELDDPLLSSMPPPFRRKASAKPIARRSSRPGLERRRLQTPQPTNAASGDQTPASNHEVPPSAAASPAKRYSVRPSRLPPASNGVGAKGGLRLPAFSAVAGRGLPPKTVAPRGAPAKPAGPPTTKAGSASVTPGAAPMKAEPATGSASGTTGSVRGSASVTAGIPPMKGDEPAGRAVLARPMSGPAAPPAQPQPLPPGVAKPGSELGIPPSGAARNQSPIGEATHPPAPAEKPAPLSVAARPLVPAPDRPPPKPPPRLDSTQHTAGAHRSEALDRSKLEDLAEKLRKARQQTNENASVSVDALAKKLETTAALLREKHQGRQIDFDVVIKDGKAIVKPIVR